MCAFDLDNVRHVYLCHSKYNLRWVGAEENLKKNDIIDWNLIEQEENLLSIALEIGLSKEDDGKNGRRLS